MPCYFQEDVFETWQLGPKLRDANPVLREALDDVGHEVLAASAQDATFDSFTEGSLPATFTDGGNSSRQHLAVPLG